MNELRIVANAFPESSDTSSTPASNFEPAHPVGFPVGQDERREKARATSPEVEDEEPALRLDLSEQRPRRRQLVLKDLERALHVARSQVTAEFADRDVARLPRVAEARCCPEVQNRLQVVLSEKDAEVVEDAELDSAAAQAPGRIWDSR